MPMPEHQSSDRNPIRHLLDEKATNDSTPKCKYLGTETDPAACTFGKPGTLPKPSKASDGLVPASFQPMRLDLPIIDTYKIFEQIPTEKPTIPRRSCIWAVVPIIQTKCDQYQPREEKK